jgi:hypothetical protein|tara:strand:- start:3917 stop:4564 length:648 start_codon:yes stop_codon:yes gene_type:complete
MISIKACSPSKVALAMLPLAFGACVQVPPSSLPEEPKPLSRSGLNSVQPEVKIVLEPALESLTENSLPPRLTIHSLAGWPETFEEFSLKTNGFKVYQAALDPDNPDTLTHQPPGPALVSGVTIIRNDLLRAYLRDNAFSATPIEMEFGEHADQECRTVIQNISGEILYLVPEHSVDPLVLLPGYTALNVDGFVSAVQYNQNVGKNYYKVIPGVLV